MEIYKHWDLVIRASGFFIKTGLTQTLKGFEDGMMLVFNPEWERLKTPLALEEMIKGLTVLLVGFQFWYMVHANMDIGRF